MQIKKDFNFLLTHGGVIMALRIYSNPLSGLAQGNLTKANNTMATSIERLSSGLRINHASDDASGLAVSQKLKAQIKGDQVAGRNTQDGVSYLQTAEGGLEVLGSMLSRMRELSVQASNGIYTSTDRTELQKEVDQLKSEINRVTAATEFNTKKLLNGDATGLASTDNNQLSAVITGEVKDGSYNVEVRNSVGTASQYQSQILKSYSDEFTARINGQGVPERKNSVFMVGTTKDLIGSMNFATSGSAGYSLKVQNLVTANVTTKSKVVHIAQFFNTDSTFTAKVSGMTSAKTATIKSSVRTGYLQFKVVNVDNNLLQHDRAGKVNNTIVTSLSTFNRAVTLEWQFYDAKTGESSGWQRLTSTQIKTTDPATAGAVTAGVTISVKSTAYGLDATFHLLATRPGTNSGFSINNGDTFSYDIQSKSGMSAKSTALTTKGGAVVTVGGGAEGHSLNSTLKIFYGAGEIGLKNNGDQVVDKITRNMYFGRLDENNGQFQFGGVAVSFKENSSSSSMRIYTATYSFSVDAGGKGISESAKLYQIANFANGDGRHMITKDGQQTITVYNTKGAHEDVIMRGQDTIQDFDNNFTAALIKLGLGMTYDMVSPGNTSAVATIRDVNRHLVDFINPGAEAPSGRGHTPSSFVMQTAKLGELSRFSVTGEEAIINGLGLHEDVVGKGSRLDITVQDASTGKLIGHDITENDKSYNILGGIQLNLDSTVGAYSYWDADSKNIKFQSAGQKTFHLNVADNRAFLQVGANEGQAFNVAVPRLDTEALGVGDAFVYSQEQASKAISKFDDALRKVASVRATIGAQVNRLNFTSTNLDTMRQNMVASNSRIEDADLASETSDFSRNQVLKQAAQSMLAQANQSTQSALSLLQG